MAVPAAPTAGEPILEPWGDVVHNAIVDMDVQAGIANLNFANAAFSGALVIVFPRPFNAVPVVVATMGGATSGVNINVGITQLSATQVTLQAREVRDTVLNGNQAVQWMAYGKRK